MLRPQRNAKEGVTNYAAASQRSKELSAAAFRPAYAPASTPSSAPNIQGSQLVSYGRGGVVSVDGGYDGLPSTLETFLEALPFDEADRELDRIKLPGHNGQTVKEYLTNPGAGVLNHEAVRNVIYAFEHEAETAGIATVYAVRYATEHRLWEDCPEPSVHGIPDLLRHFGGNRAIGHLNLGVGMVTLQNRANAIKIIEHYWGHDWFGRIPQSMRKETWESAYMVPRNILEEIRDNAKQGLSLKEAIEGWAKAVAVRTDLGKRRKMGRSTQRAYAYLVYTDVRTLNPEKPKRVRSAAKSKTAPDETASVLEAAMESYVTVQINSLAPPKMTPVAQPAGVEEPGSASTSTSPAKKKQRTGERDVAFWQPQSAEEQSAEDEPEPWRPSKDAVSVVRRAENALQKRRIGTDNDLTIPASAHGGEVDREEILGLVLDDSDDENEAPSIGTVEPTSEQGGSTGHSSEIETTGPGRFGAMKEARIEALIRAEEVHANPEPQREAEDLEGALQRQDEETLGHMDTTDTSISHKIEMRPRYSTVSTSTTAVTVATSHVGVTSRTYDGAGSGALERDFEVDENDGRDWGEIETEWNMSGSTSMDDDDIIQTPLNEVVESTPPTAFSESTADISDEEPTYRRGNYFDALFSNVRDAFYKQLRSGLLVGDLQREAEYLQCLEWASAYVDPSLISDSTVQAYGLEATEEESDVIIMDTATFESRLRETKKVEGKECYAWIPKKPLIIKNDLVPAFNPEDYTPESVAAELSVRSHRKSTIDVRDSRLSSTSAVTVEDYVKFVAQSGSSGPRDAAKMSNAINLRSLFDCPSPRFMQVRRLRLLHILAGRGDMPGKREEREPSDIRDSFVFALHGLQGAFSGTHYDALGGTYVRVLSGCRFWTICPYMTKAELQMFRSEGSDWFAKSGKLIALEAGDILLMPEPIVHTVITPTPSYAEGGMLWDSANILPILRHLQWLATNQGCTNEPTQFELAPILSELELLVAEHPGLFQPTETSSILEEVTKVRLCTSCSCGEKCSRTSCPCAQNYRRCTAFCSLHPSIPSKKVRRACMLDPILTKGS